MKNMCDFYTKAKAILPPNVFAFIDGGSLDELALERNLQSFKDCLLMPRVLCGVKEVSTQITLLGHAHSAPILIAPVAYQQLWSKHGELDTLGAANQFNTTMIFSMFSSIDYVSVAKHKTSPVWAQMYLLKDRAVNENYVRLVESLGFDALVLTVDAPVYGKRERERANPLTFPMDANFSHLKDIGIDFDACLKTKKHLSTLLDESISWNDLDWLCSITKLPIILKGIIDPRDTSIALNYPNVKGIVISNHGGRQLDSSCAPLNVIQAHKQIVGDKALLLLDGGIMRGSDIFKAMAMGADATLIGRAAMWPLAVGGKDGLLHALSILQSELIDTMILCGCSDVSAIRSDFLANEGSIWKQS